SRADDPQPVLPENVDDAFAQWNLRTDECEIDSFVSCEFQQCPDIVRSHRNQLGVRAYAPVAWCGINLREFRALGKGVNDRMFPAAVTNNQDFHRESFEICVSVSFSAPVR